MYILYYWNNGCLEHAQYYFYTLRDVIEKASQYNDWHIENKRGTVVARSG